MEHKAGQSFDPTGFLGSRSLIVGDVNSGKTTYTQTILDGMCRAELAPRILILDLAPEIPRDLEEKTGLRGVGGRLLPPPEKDVLYVWARTKPPRLTASSDDVAMALAERNREEIERLLHGIDRGDRDILFVNDVSLYLHAGRAVKLIGYLEGAQTLVVNGYYGEKLGEGLLSRRERAEMDSLVAFFHRVIRL